MSNKINFYNIVSLKPGETRHYALSIIDSNENGVWEPENDKLEPGIFGEGDPQYAKILLYENAGIDLDRPQDFNRMGYQINLFQGLSAFETNQLLDPYKLSYYFLEAIKFSNYGGFRPEYFLMLDTLVQNRENIARKGKAINPAYLQEEISLYHYLGAQTDSGYLIERMEKVLSKNKTLFNEEKKRNPRLYEKKRKPPAFERIDD